MNRQPVLPPALLASGRWRLCLALSLVLLLSACASLPLVPPSLPGSILADSRFTPLAAPAEPMDALALSPAMKRYADEVLRKEHRPGGRRDHLLDALYTERALKVEFDSEITRSAAEAFEQRAGNCMSLAMLTGAFAEYLQLPLEFQQVYLPDVVSRQGKLLFNSGHINVRLGSALPDTGQTDWGSDWIVVDFLPQNEVRRQRAQIINSRTVAAMYANNRAAELLAGGDTNSAYWWARAGVMTDPGYLTTYNTLGVVYLHSGHADLAGRAFRTVLVLEPDNTQAMTNLINLLQTQGGGREMQELQQRLLALEPVPPYQYFDEGLIALKAGDYKKAVKLLEREVARASYNHEFHFWLAIAYLYVDEPKRARQHLEIALEESTTLRATKLYAAKLEVLRSSQKPDNSTGLTLRRR